MAYTFLGSIFELCYIQNRVITNYVIKEDCSVNTENWSAKLYCTKINGEKQQTKIKAFKDML